MMKNKRILSIDLETYSSVDIRTAGVYKYAEDMFFEILLLAYAFDDEPVTVLDLWAGDEIPVEVSNAILGYDDTVLCSAFNANFERVCLSRYYRDEDWLNEELGYMAPRQVPKTGFISPVHWRCSAVQARYLALPGHLGGAAEVLHLKMQKEKVGKSLINYFCKPCKPTKVNGGRCRNLPTDEPEKWETFKHYNLMDVEVERNLRKKLSVFPVPEKEWQLWFVDQEISDRGVRLKRELFEHAIDLDGQYRERLKAEMKDITGLANPNSLQQLKGWIKEQTGEDIKALNKDTIPDILAKHTDRPIVSRALAIRKMLGKTSTSKYQTMEKCACKDGRARGLLMFYGASHSGRWAGRLLQVQNLPQNHLPDLDIARDLLIAGDYEMIETLYPSIPGVLSELIRTALIPPKGCKFIVSDFSAIEARVIAWLAGETWRQEVFATHGKIYEASASAMFGVPIESIGKGSTLRKKGKIAELALGYQGGKGALQAMGGEAMGLSLQEMQDIVYNWRAANPHIVQLWHDIEDAAKYTVGTHRPTKTHGLTFTHEKGFMFIELPSGRRLSYPHCKMGTNRFGNESIIYSGTYVGGWGDLETYGGKLTENVIQAIARDCLAIAMMRMNDAGYKIVIHVHDEVIIDATPDQKLDDVNDIMSIPIDWAPGLLLKGDGFETPYYKKD